MALIQEVLHIYQDHTSGLFERSCVLNSKGQILHPLRLKKKRERLKKLYFEVYTKNILYYVKGPLGTHFQRV